ncbi:sigS mRNA-stabilizing protein SroA [Staphylococcus sp. HMSC036D05]|uniref:sigS mRNA-stabilizing protein SroA n=1 Tax=Staphylococcus sp. HMSC036D05 TaxID=1715059 RepID=UPI0008A94518|nr:hypothetical protein [Staphylococcus sp. HMSC036D05]OHO70533.1 hypothetical protein HMPREF2580_10215 [Staphylococcus sp. HMSC036D05]
MNEVNQMTALFTEIKHNSEGKAVEHKRRFANLNPSSSNNQVRTFSTIIERLTGEKYDKVEVVKTEALI